MNNAWWLLIIPVLILLLVNGIDKGPEIDLTRYPWLEEYRNSLDPSLMQYTKETYYYDYSNPEIQYAVKEILNQAESVEDAVQLALDYVYANVAYDSGEDDDTCFSSKASDVLERGTGQCDSMSTLLISLLNGMGIVSRPEAGCLAIDYGCYLSFSIIGVPPPKVQEIQGNSRRGGLHLWSEAYVPSLGGWVRLESTNGQIIKENSCLIYLHELYPENRRDFCVSSNAEFIRQCRDL